MATLRPGLLTPVEPDWGLDAQVESLAPHDAGGSDIETLDIHVQEDAGGLELEAARIVMAVGMGIGSPENLPVIYRLAESIGATVAATRNVTDAGWLPQAGTGGPDWSGHCPRTVHCRGHKRRLQPHGRHFRKRGPS